MICSGLRTHRSRWLLNAPGQRTPFPPQPCRNRGSRAQTLKSASSAVAFRQLPAFRNEAVLDEPRARRLFGTHDPLAFSTDRRNVPLNSVLLRGTRTVLTLETYEFPREAQDHSSERVTNLIPNRSEELSLFRKAAPDRNGKINGLTETGLRPVEDAPH